MTARVLGLVVVGLLAVTAADAAAPIEIGADQCAQGELRAPKGPFSVQVFCEDALSTHIGVVYAGPMGAPVDGGWAITDRFWQQRNWAADVQDVAWSDDGFILFVATSGVYGSGGLFQLDLRARKAYSLSPPSDRLVVRIRRLADRWIEYTTLDIESNVTSAPQRAAVRRSRH